MNDIHQHNFLELGSVKTYSKAEQEAQDCKEVANQLGISLLRGPQL
jgi:hypothetical protein